jgi:hypothetical protein
MNEERNLGLGNVSTVCPVFGGVNKHRFVVFQQLVDEKRAVTHL